MRRVSRALTRRICVRSCPGKVQGDIHTTEGEGFHLPECDEIGKCDIETGDVELSPFIGVAVSSEVGIAFHQVDGGTVPQGEDEAPLFRALLVPSRASWEAGPHCGGGQAQNAGDLPDEIALVVMRVKGEDGTFPPGRGRRQGSRLPGAPGRAGTPEARSGSGTSRF